MSDALTFFVVILVAALLVIFGFTTTAAMTPALEDPHRLDYCVSVATSMLLFAIAASRFEAACFLPAAGRSAAGVTICVALERTYAAWK